MSNGDILGLAVKNLARRKTRTLLAIIGVVIGTCAIVVMLSIGFGLSQGFQEQIESWGNLHTVEVYGGGSGIYYGGMGYEGGGSSSEDAKLTDKTIANFEKIKGVDAATPVLEEYVTIEIGKEIARINIIGIKPEVMEKFGYKAEEGRLLQSGDKYALVFGSQTAYDFYNPKKQEGSAWWNTDEPPSTNVITDKMMLTGDTSYGIKRRPGERSWDDDVDYKEYKVKGVGVLALTNDRPDYSAYMNVDTLKDIQADIRRARRESNINTTEYNNAMIYVGDINDVGDVCEELRSKGYQTYSLNDILESMQETARMIQGVLGSIGAISLFVAALGITNTMIMSIYERTKEIGVMKVIGASLKDIRRLFLLEAGLIGLIGGIVGVILSYLISFLMNSTLAEVIGGALGYFGGGGSAVSIIPSWVALGALLFSMAVGLLSGYYPAKRAMGLSALESLRNE